MLHPQLPDQLDGSPTGVYDLAVIGGGPAGLVAARAAADLGVRVALIERNLIGGASLSSGSVPSKTMLRSARLYAEMQHAARVGVRAPSTLDVDFAAVMQRLRRVRARLGRADTPLLLRAAGVEVFRGQARFIAGDRLVVEGAELRFRKAMIATGSRPHRPSVPGLEEVGYLTNESVFDLEELPRRLLVIGGGPLGCELAQAFQRLGTKTAIVQQQPFFLPLEERDAAQLLSDAFARDGIHVRLNTSVVGVRMEAGEKRIDLISEGDRNTIAVDQILVGTGRLPNVEDLGLEAADVDLDGASGIRVDDHLRTSNPRIFAAGDVCLEHKFTHTAEVAARIVVDNALRGRRQRMSTLTIPWCTFTDPEIAHVGLYVREANERRLSIKTFTVPLHDVARATMDSEEVGFVKIHVSEGSARIVGATIVGRHAGEMINEITLAMVAGIGLDTLARVIHAYPTQAGAIQQAAAAYVRAQTVGAPSPAARVSTKRSRRRRPGR